MSKAFWFFHCFLLISAISFLPTARAAQVFTSGCMTSECHKDIRKNPVLHRPIKTGNCGICHFKSGSDRPNLASGDRKVIHRNLVKFDKDKINETCITCHDQMYDYLQDRNNPHNKITEKPCTSCHDPHGSDQGRLFASDTFRTMCFQCHTKLKTTLEKAAVHHSPTTDEKACLNCHEFHNGKIRKLLLVKAEEICQTCHSKKLVTPAGREIENIGEKVKKLPFVHKPVLGKCITCHQPHAAEGEHLLEAPLPKSYYGKFESSKYQLCWDCHDESLATSPETKDTKFRNEKANLHYFHLQRGDKSYGCILCHDVHATSQSKLIKTSFVFQGVEVPMKFQSSLDGGSCTNACHGEKKYDRKKAVQNEIGR